MDTSNTGHGPPSISRRRALLGTAAAAAAGLAAPGNARAGQTTESRRVRIRRRVTGELFDAEYWKDGYNEPAVRRFSAFARDSRTDEQIAMNPLLLDYLYALRIETESDRAFELLSGYRSASSNKKLRLRNAAVAEHSFHIIGQALDIRLPGTHLARLYAAAVRLGFGGIGYYPKGNFIHIDTGPRRRW